MGSECTTESLRVYLGTLLAFIQVAGLFRLFDILFDTYYMPKDKTPIQFGVTEPIAMTLWGQLSYPFRKAVYIKEH